MSGQLTAPSSAGCCSPDIPPGSAGEDRAVTYGAIRVATTLPATVVPPRRRRRDQTAGVSGGRGGEAARLEQATALLLHPSQDLVNFPAKPPLRDRTTGDGHGGRRRHPVQRLPPHYRPLPQQGRHRSTLRSVSPAPSRARRRNQYRTLPAPSSVRVGERDVARKTEAGRYRRRHLRHLRRRNPGRRAAASTYPPRRRHQKGTTALVPVADRGRQNRTRRESRVATNLVESGLGSRLPPLPCSRVAAT